MSTVARPVRRSERGEGGSAKVDHIVRTATVASQRAHITDNSRFRILLQRPKQLSKSPLNSVGRPLALCAADVKTLRLRTQERRGPTPLLHWYHLRRGEATCRTQCRQLRPHGQTPTVVN